MKISCIFTIILITALTFSLSAQPVKLGEEALNRGDYRVAQEHFNQVIEKQDQADPVELSLAYYYRAWTWIKLYGTGPGDIRSVMSDPSGEMLIKAYNDLVSSLLHEDGRLTGRINDLLVQLEPGLIQYGLVMVNRAEDQREAGKEYLVTAENAIRYLGPATRIHDSFLAYDLLGQALMLTGDDAKALEMFEKSVGAYANHPPQVPDFMVGYATFRLATLYRDLQGDEDRCLDAIQAGRKLLEAEYRRLTGPDSKVKGVALKSLEGDYFKVMNDLHTLELETYMRTEAKASEAQAIFRSEMTQHPNDVNLVIAYASLFESSDPAVAIEYYLKALAMDTGNELATFNLGAVYYNQGQKYFNLGVRAEDEDKQDLNIATAQEYFILARPIFEQLHQKDPDDLETITALKNICFATDDFQGFEHYSILEKQ